MTKVIAECSNTWADNNTPCGFVGELLVRLSDEGTYDWVCPTCTAMYYDEEMTNATH